MDLLVDGWAHAKAHVNIALMKYWGKAPKRNDDEQNLPAVPSLSLTLNELYTETWVRFAPELPQDTVVLDGVALGGRALARAVVILDALRARYEVASPFEVRSKNHVPTAAGLASSASGMAALAVAAGRCVGLEPERDAETLSALARLGSGSASRSIFGGWVKWAGRAAEPVEVQRAQEIALQIAIVEPGPKAMPSRDGMIHTMETSPYYRAWVAQAHAAFPGAEAALRAGDFQALFEAMELSTYRMHAAMMASSPPLNYLEPTSWAVIQTIETLKRRGVVCGVTLDAGPNVKVFSLLEDAPAVHEALSGVSGLRAVLSASPGPGASVRVVQGAPDG